MPGPGAFLKSCATPRALAASALAAVVLALTVKFALIPPYESMTGYVPFDAQPRLSQFMVGVELGAFAKGEATGAYALFAAGDALSAAASAWLFMLFWTWLFAEVPTRLFAFLSRGGIIMMPLYVLVLDVAAKVAFFRLVNGLEEPAYAATVDFSVFVHRLAVALADIRNAVTAALVLIAAVSLLLKRFAPRKPRAPL
jgi:hypothetical protein